MTILSFLQQTDLSVLFFINHQLVNPVFDFLFSTPHLYVFWGFVMGFFFFIKKDKKLVLLMIAAFLVSSLTVIAVKDLVHRERPYQVLDVRQLIPEENNKSFPSNHAQLSFALSTIVFYFYRRTGLVLFLLSLLIGMGRIYVGVHYPSDVLGGAVIGVLFAVMILRVSKMHKRRR